MATVLAWRNLWMLASKVMQVDLLKIFGRKKQWNIRFLLMKKFIPMFLMWKDEGLLEFFFSKTPLIFCVWFDLKAWSQRLGCKSARSCMDFSQTDGMWGTQLTACRSEEELLAQLASGAGQSGRVEREKLIQDNLTCLSMASSSASMQLLCRIELSKVRLCRIVSDLSSPVFCEQVFQVENTSLPKLGEEICMGGRVGKSRAYNTCSS